MTISSSNPQSGGLRRKFEDCLRPGERIRNGDQLATDAASKRMQNLPNSLDLKSISKLKSAVVSKVNFEGK